MFVVEVTVGLHVLSGWVPTKYLTTGSTISLVRHMAPYSLINSRSRSHPEMER